MIYIANKKNFIDEDDKDVMVENKNNFTTPTFFSPLKHQVDVCFTDTGCFPLIIIIIIIMTLTITITITLIQAVFHYLFSGRKYQKSVAPKTIIVKR